MLKEQLISEIMGKNEINREINFKKSLLQIAVASELSDSKYESLTGTIPMIPDRHKKYYPFCDNITTNANTKLLDSNEIDSINKIPNNKKCFKTGNTHGHNTILNYFPKVTGNNSK